MFNYKRTGSNRYMHAHTHTHRRTQTDTTWQAHKALHSSQNEIIDHSQQAHGLQNWLSRQVEQVSSVSSRFMTAHKHTLLCKNIVGSELWEMWVTIPSFCRSLRILKVSSNSVPLLYIQMNLSQSKHTGRVISQTSFANKIFDSGLMSGNVRCVWLLPVKEVVNSVKPILFHHVIPLRCLNRITRVNLTYMNLVAWINQDQSGSSFLSQTLFDYIYFILFVFILLHFILYLLTEQI